MNHNALERHMLDRIPLTRAMALRVVALNSQGLTLGAPLQANINDKGTVFAGSISALLTLSGWALLHALLDGERNGLRIAVTRSRLRYTHPVTADFQAHCAHPGPEAIDALAGNVAATGKARITLRAELLQDASTCAVYEGIYVIQTRG